VVDFDLFVLGTGPAGQRAAVQAAKLGKRVGICERREVVGGVCINTGTIPSKTFREAVLYLTGYQQRGIYGPGYRVKEDITMAELLLRCDHVIQREVQVVRDQMRRNGVQNGAEPMADSEGIGFERAKIVVLGLGRGAARWAWGSPGWCW